MFNWIVVLALVLIFLLWYIYSGYLLLLRFLLKVQRKPVCISSTPCLIKVTVLITVYNEEAYITERIDNILSQDYPNELLEVLVASDGSTDMTDFLVTSYGDARVKLYIAEGDQGKTATQNEAIKLVSGQVVIFTDARSQFKSSFIKNITAVFNDISVGAADGHLLFAPEASNQIAQAQGYYWRYELSLRIAESQLGLLAVASGACLALRTSAFREMDPSIGEDCIVPLSVVMQGLKVVHVPDAIAFDVMENSLEHEFKSRVRMTLRNWQGTISCSRLLNPFFHLRYAFSLWSHKLLRWLSPFLILLLTVCGMIGMFTGNTILQILFGLLLFIYALAALASISKAWRHRIPGAMTIYSFMIANTGFLVGVLKAVFGKKIYKYR